MLELRKAEVGHDPADDGGAAPDVPALAGEIPSGRVEQPRGQVDHGDLGNVVGGTTDAGAQSAKTDGGRLGNDGVGDRPEGTGKNEGDDDTKNGLCVVGRRVLWDRGADAEDKKKSDVGGGAPKIDGSTTEPAGQEPRARVGDELKTRIDQVELESKVVRNAGLYAGSQSSRLGSCFCREKGGTHAQRRKLPGWQSGYRQSSATRTSSR